MDISILKQVLLNGDIMMQIQSYKRGISVNDPKINKLIIKNCGLKAYKEIIKYPQYEDQFTCILYNKIEILDTMKYEPTEKNFAYALLSRNIEMIEKFKNNASKTKQYIINDLYDLEVLKYILELNILECEQIKICYRDSTGMYNLSLNCLVHIRGDIEYLEWYCDFASEKIDLELLIEQKKYKETLYFITERNDIIEKSQLQPALQLLRRYFKINDQLKILLEALIIDGDSD